MGFVSAALGLLLGDRRRAVLLAVLLLGRGVRRADDGHVDAGREDGEDRRDHQLNEQEGGDRVRARVRVLPVLLRRLVLRAEAVLGADRVEGVDRREEEERGLCINQSVSRVESFGELTSRRWCGGHDSAAAGDASRQFDFLCTERRRKDGRLELGLAREGLLAAADEDDEVGQAVEEAHN